MWFQKTKGDQTQRSAGITHPHADYRNDRNLPQLKRQAKELLKTFLAGEADAVAEVRAHYHDADASSFALHDAQLVLARSYGLESWPKLKAFVDGVTAGRLCDAVERGDTLAVGDMLSRRPEIVNLERPGHGEYRALHLAVLRQDAAMTRLLMEHRADARAGIWPHREATSALRLARERDYDDIVSIIDEAERLRRGSNSSAPPVPELEEAMRRGDEEQAIAILAVDPALIHSSHPDGWTPFHRAATMLHENTVAWLLEQGADANQRGKDDWTPLGLAASQTGWEKKTGGPERFKSVAQLLLRHGAELTSVSAVALGEADWVRARHAERKLVTAGVFDVFGPFG